MKNEVKAYLPEPIAPIKSARIVKAPMQIPPQVAAMGIYLVRVFTIEVSLWPCMIISSAFNFLATSLADSPEISIQYLANKPQDVRTNIIYRKINLN